MFIPCKFSVRPFPFSKSMPISHRPWRLWLSWIFVYSDGSSRFALLGSIPLTRQSTREMDLRQAAWCHSHRTWEQFLAS